MKAPIIIALTIALALPLAAQEATLDTPITEPARTKLKVQSFEVNVPIGCLCASVVVAYQDAANVERARARFQIASADAEGQPTVTDLAAFLTAIGTPRAGETGVTFRRMNFRVLGFLVDSGKLSGVTLVP